MHTLGMAGEKYKNHLLFPSPVLTESGSKGIISARLLWGTPKVLYKLKHF